MIFLDTGAFLARYARRDQHREQARPVWAKLGTTGTSLVTSNFVIDETLTLLARRTDYVHAAETAAELYQSPSLEIVRPEHEDEIAAVSVFRKFADQRISFTDCISFVLLKKHGIRRVFSFDRHFRLAGFETVP